MSGDEVTRALDVARGLAQIGVPVFLAYPSAEHPTGYAPPAGWQHSLADPAVVDGWRPGLALCVLTGCGLDLVDLDPRNRADELGLPSVSLPEAWATAHTPSGGMHLFVPPIGEASRDGVEAGVDVKAGAPDGSGRGFAFIAPTVRVSKVDGRARPYAWQREPSPDEIARAWRYLSWERPHPTTLALAGRIRELRAAGRSGDGTPRTVPASVAVAERDRVLRGLVEDLRRWSVTGWGGEAHAGLLAASTYLARVDPEGAEACWLWAFEAAGVEPDEADLSKLASALDAAVPDRVVPDAELSPQELFWAGARVPEAALVPDESPPPSFGPRVVAGEGPDGGAGGRGRFLDEHALAAIPRPDPLVEGVLWSSTVARVFGGSGVGKSWVALDLAAHAASGTPWLGRPTRRVRVGYVAAEGAPGIDPRLAAWRDYHRTDTGVLVRPEAVTIGGGDWAEFCSEVADLSLGLVILDTQAACTVGYNENSNGDAAVILGHLYRLVASSGCCVLLVHHVGQDDGERSRGASGMFGGLDTELRLAAGRGDGELLLWQAKQKYAPREKRPTRLTLHAHADGLVVLPAGQEREEDRRARAATAEAHVAALQASGEVHAGQSARHLVRHLREDLGRAGDDHTLREAVRLFKARAGVAGVVLPDYLGDPSDLVSPQVNGHAGPELALSAPMGVA